MLKFQGTTNSFYYPQEDWGLFKTPYWKLRKKYIPRVKNTRCYTKHTTEWQLRKIWEIVTGCHQTVVTGCHFFVRVVCKGFCSVINLWNATAHSVSWGCYFGWCWTFFYSQIYTTSLRPAGQYLLKLSEHEKATLPCEFFIPWGHRSHFLLLPADLDSRVDYLWAFIFYYDCSLLSFAIPHRYLSDIVGRKGLLGGPDII